MSILKNALVGLLVSGLIASGTAHASETRAVAALPVAGVGGVSPHLAKLKRHDTPVAAYAGNSDAAVFPIAAGLAGVGLVTAICFAVNVCGRCDSTGG